MSEPFVVAVIVTYRRTDLLPACVESVCTQTRTPDLILVIDNAEGAREALPDDPRIRVVETGDNLGCAGGYEVGFRLALREGADKIWAMDDDARADPRCLERLLAAGGPVARPVEERDGRAVWNQTSWNGPLFDASVIRRVGLPRREFFFWIEDTEYFFRIRVRHGIEIHLVPDARVTNLRPDARRRGNPRTWRLYYEVRNTLVYRLLEKPLTPHNLLQTAKVVFGKPLAILLYEPSKIASLRLWWWGVRDFALGRMGRRVDPEEWPATGSEPRQAAGGRARAV